MPKNNHISRRGFNIALCISVCLIYLIPAFATAPNYGLTWDEAMNEWYIGERNLRYYLTLDKSWLDFKHPVDFSMDGRHPDLRHSGRPWRTQNFGNMLSSLGCYVFFFKLGWMNAIKAHHAPNFLLMAGVLAVMFSFMRKNFGIAATLIGVFAIAFQPRFWAHAHFNTKDFPYACIMAFTMLAAVRGILNKSAGWVVFASVLLGLAGATKPNAALIPAILALWYLFARTDISSKVKSNVNPHNEEFGRKGFLVALLAAPLVAVLVFYAAWPYLWTSPIEALRLYLQWYMGSAVKGEPGFQWATFIIFLIVQPPAVLIFGTIGSWVAVRGIIKNENRQAQAFLLFWFILPVIRVLLPRMYNYDGVRHFIEYAIPLGALTGIGAAQSFKWLISAFKRRASQPVRAALAGIIVALPFLTWSATMIRIHPYELVYFNFLLGGAAGAERKCYNCGLATDYWGSSYRQGIEWLNANAEHDALVVVPIAGHIVRAVQRMWVRPDLRIAVTRHKSDEFLHQSLQGVRPGHIYVMYITRTRAYGELVRRVDYRGEIKHAIIVDGVPILKIVKLHNIAEFCGNKFPHTKR